jgi:hypothetical protein
MATAGSPRDAPQLEHSAIGAASSLGASSVGACGSRGCLGVESASCAVSRSCHLRPRNQACQRSDEAGRFGASWCMTDPVSDGVRLAQLSSCGTLPPREAPGSARREAHHSVCGHPWSSSTSSRPGQNDPRRYSRARHRARVRGQSQHGIAGHPHRSTATASPPRTLPSAVPRTRSTGAGCSHFCDPANSRCRDPTHDRTAAPGVADWRSLAQPVPPHSCPGASSHTDRGRGRPPRNQATACAVASTAHRAGCNRCTGRVFHVKQSRLSPLRSVRRAAVTHAPPAGTAAIERPVRRDIGFIAPWFVGHTERRRSRAPRRPLQRHDADAGQTHSNRLPRRASAVRDPPSRDAEHQPSPRQPIRSSIQQTMRFTTPCGIRRHPCGRLSHRCFRTATISYRNQFSHTPTPSPSR